MKKAFTLIELMISIVILSIMMLFLYKSYAGLNKSNKVFVEEKEKISKIEQIKKVLYLDFTLAKHVNILIQDKKEDVTFLQSSNSLHNRINPYIGYFIKEKKLYRIESLKELKEYPLSLESEFVADFLGNVEIFRVYPSRDASAHLYLIHILFKDKSEILLKVKALNVI